MFDLRKSKNKHQKPPGLPEQPEISMWKWEHSSMKFITKLPKTPRGKDTIWVISLKKTYSVPYYEGKGYNGATNSTLPERSRIPAWSAASDHLWLRLSTHFQLLEIFTESSVQAVGYEHNIPPTIRWPDWTNDLNSRRYATTLRSWLWQHLRSSLIVSGALLQQQLSHEHESCTIRDHKNESTQLSINSNYPRNRKAYITPLGLKPHEMLSWRVTCHPYQRNSGGWTVMVYQGTSRNHGPDGQTIQEVKIPTVKAWWNSNVDLRSRWNIRSKWRLHLFKRHPHTKRVQVKFRD